MTKRVLLTGANGQIGTWLYQRLREDTQYELFAFNRTELDITDESLVKQLMATVKPDVVINAAAYTAVDKAESEVDKAMQVNVEGVKYLAQAAKQHDALLVHLSTDYVFRGDSDVPYVEQDKPSPLTHYGRSKWLGEEAVIAESPAYIILRTAWVFGEYGHNFVKTMLRLGAERTHLNIVNDQLGGPTYAGDIVNAILVILQRYFTDGSRIKSGIYHFTGIPYMSWYDFAKAIFIEAVAQGVLQQAPTVSAISSAAYPTPAQRPANSRLALDKIAKDFGIAPSDWQAALQQVISDYKKKIQE
ncbi:dTDP-4-dehydrorhamnose reductase [Pelistega suis]|uniref:dTDP-4-dehydrorhamnose reductase n=1 Tax=Pelistega suis TaxID=1631957 RepID=A0A849P442_9BURK|nr:dTDP-4-dehydrorhamnose reductase [Pelistega suis]NOL50803.1 dTDP-4-dehydrorhamnose reductase [Pelistega suis]